MQIWSWFFHEFVENSYIAVTVKRHAKIGVYIVHRQSAHEAGVEREISHVLLGFIPPRGKSCEK
jgi:hypothetical protein